MPNFSGITSIIFPQAIINDAFEFLREVGLQGYEAVTLFAGKLDKNVYEIKHLYVPVQQTYKTRHGLMYKVSSEELSKLDDWLYDNQLTLFCQMHTHPTDAYHSLADDENCIVTSTGGFSVVIPNFAEDEIDIDNWAVYRLEVGTGWTEVDGAEVRTLFKIR